MIRYSKRKKLTRTSIAILTLGIFLLILAIINLVTLDSLNPAILRAEVITCISCVTLIGIATLWIKIEPKKTEKVNLTGKQGLYICESINKNIKEELAWGSHQILTATAASTILIRWNNNVILERGLINNSIFTPGNICKMAIDKKQMIVLSNTSNYPDSYEFDNIIPDIPSIIVCPLSSKGIVVVGGWSSRCFTKSDEIWISGWSKKLSDLLLIS